MRWIVCLKHRACSDLSSLQNVLKYRNVPRNTFRLQFVTKQWFLFCFCLSLNLINNFILGISSMTLRTITNVNIFRTFFLHILKAYARIYPLAKFQVEILLHFCIKADSNSAQNVLSPKEKCHRSVRTKPRISRMRAKSRRASCSHRRAYKSNTLNTFWTVTNQSRSSVCGGFSLRALGKRRFKPY